MGARAGILPSRSSLGAWVVWVFRLGAQAPPQPQRKPWGPLLGSHHATHWHSTNTPKAGAGWEHYITLRVPGGVENVQAKCKLSLKVIFYLQHPNDFCSALDAFLYFNKTDFFRTIF